MKKRLNALKVYFSGRISSNTLVRTDYAKYYGEHMELCKVEKNGVKFY